MCVCVCVCVCVFKFVSEITGPAEAKFHEEPLWDRGRKLVQMSPVICFFSLLSAPAGGGI